MIVRSAILEGDVDPADRPAFDRAMEGVVLAEIATYPGIKGVTLRRTVSVDTGAPPIYMQFDLLFADLAAMEAALASPVRAAVRTRLAAAMSPFHGRVYHVVSQMMDPSSVGSESGGDKS